MNDVRTVLLAMWRWALLIGALSVSGAVVAHDYVPSSGYVSYLQDCRAEEISCYRVGSIFNATESSIYSTFIQGHNQYISDGFNYFCYGAYAYYSSGWWDTTYAGSGAREIDYTAVHECWILPVFVGDEYHDMLATQVVDYFDCSIYHEPAPDGFRCLHVNQFPIIINYPPTTSVEGQYYIYTPQTLDVDNYPSPITYEVLNLPYWAYFNPANGQITGIPPYGSSDVYSGITLIASDGLDTDSVTFSITVDPGNTPPVADAGGLYSARALEPVYFNAFLSYDADGDPLTYTWNFGDGTTGTGVAPTHTYITDGTFTVILTVSDGMASSTDVATAFISVANRAPVADSGSLYTARANEPLQFTAALSYDPDGDQLIYLWDFGDGGSAPGVAPVHTYATPGVYLATVTVSDGDLFSTDTAEVSITDANRAPIANAGGPYLGRINAAVIFNASKSSDPDGDQLTFLWDFGDGNDPTPGGGEFASHVYSQSGTYNVSVLVSDSVDTATANTTVDIAVNQMPTANPGGPYQAGVGDPLIVNGSLSSDPDGDTLTYTWDFGDGGTATGDSANNIYDAEGTYTITLIVNDGYGDSLPVATTVEVYDYNPDLNRGAGLDGALCSDDPNMSASNPINNASNPINGATGNKYQPELDYVGAGPMPLAFQRHYNSSLGTTARLGSAWRHNFDRSISVMTVAGQTLATAQRAEGNALTYTSVAGGWQARAGVVDRLESTAGGWRLIDADDTVESYDATGRLLSVRTRLGLSQTLGYNPDGSLATVSDDFGRSLQFGYDGQGRVQTLTDSAGKVYRYDYDAAGRLWQVTNPDASTRQYLYEDAVYANAMTGVIDEKGNRFASWSYDAQGRGKSSTHALGAESTTLAFNADGTTTITDALGQARTYTYSTQNGQKKTSTVLGPACGACGGGTTSTTFDANGFPDIVTDFNGNVTDLNYNARGLVEQRIDAVGTPQARTVITQWHASLRVPVCSIEPTRTVSLTFNAAGQLSGRTVIDTSDAAKFATAASKTCAAILARSDFAMLNTRTVSYTYTPAGLLETVDGPRTDVSDVTRYVYEPGTGNLAEVHDALGHVTYYSLYDAHGRQGRIETPNGLVTTLTYDLRGRPDIVTVGSEVTDYDYDVVGNLQHVTQADGAFLDYTYDAAQRLTDIKDQLGNHIHYTLDGLGNRKQTETYDPAGTLARTHTLVYSQANRLQQSLGAANQSTDYLEYDDNGNLKHVRDPELHNVYYTYDALNRLETTTDELQGTVVKGYDAAGHLASVQDPRGVVTTYNYDGLGNRTQLTSADTGVTLSTQFDDAGNVLTQMDARGKTTAFTYDALNRLTQVTYQDGSTALLEYDTGVNAVGRISMLTDVSGVTRWSYDSHGRIKSRSQTQTGVTLTTSYDYDPLTGRLVSQTTPGGHIITYSYTQGQLTGMALDGGPLVSAIGYEPFGPVNRWTSGNGVVNSRGYDQDGQLSRYSVVGGARDLRYTPVGNLWTVTDPANAVNNKTYGYDALYRLKTYQGLPGDESYDYDGTGNRTSQTVGGQTYGSVIDPVSNMLQSVAGPQARSYSYDPAGNVTGDGVHTYGYDDRGRFVTLDNGAASYDTNEQGQRVAKYLSNGREVRYVYGAGNELVAETDAAGTVLTEYVYFNGAPVAVLRNDQDDDGVVDSADNCLLTANADQRDSNGDGYGTVCDADLDNNGAVNLADYQMFRQALGTTNADADFDGNGSVNLADYAMFKNMLGKLVGPRQGQVVVATLVYVHGDHLGTPLSLTDAAGTVVWRATYTPYGAATVEEDPDGNGQPVRFNLRFPGQYYDAESGLHYNNQRTYDPQTGRYISSDPIGLMGGLNSYIYGLVNPTNFSDPLGMVVESDNTNPSPWLFGTAVHSYVKGWAETQGLLGNTSLKGTFGIGPGGGELRADMLDESRKTLWELKPYSWSEGYKYTAGLAQCASYVKNANEDDPYSYWRVGNSKDALGGKDFVTLPGVMTFWGNDYEITLYADPNANGQDTGLVFYKADLVRSAREKLESQIRQALEAQKGSNGAYFVPPPSWIFVFP